VECLRGDLRSVSAGDAPGGIRLHFLQEGSATYVLGGRQIAAVPRHLSVFCSALPHQIFVAGETLQLYVAHLPLSVFLTWKLPDPFVQRLWEGCLLSEPNNPRQASDVHAWQQWELDLQRDEAWVRKAALLEMEARVLRLAKDVLAEGFSRTVDAPERTASLEKPAERMARFISQHFTESISVKDIEGVSGVSSEEAAAAFSEAFGVHVLEYLTQYRLAYAQRLLVTSRLPLVEIASRSGFESMARFNQVFRQSFGMAALEFRRMHPAS
jgi:AraC family transcriptional regulator, melibiose operon regulatory protein